MAEQGLTIGVGELRFNVRYTRARTGDHGPSLRIYGDVEGKPVQLLRFDCFENQPHFHYDPEGKNNQLRMDKTKVSDPIAWSMDYLRGNVASLVRIAGYSALADQVDEAALIAAHRCKSSARSMASGCSCCALTASSTSHTSTMILMARTTASS